MQVILYSSSESLIRSMRSMLQQSLQEVHSELPETVSPDHLHLLHITSLGADCLSWISQNSGSSIIAVCSDRPDIREMLECVDAGSKAYCNSYMQQALYQQLLRLLSNGQSWFPPQMLAQTFTLAKNSLNATRSQVSLDSLTQRERQVATAVSQGLSNKRIAEQCEISEQTVKTHLTSIFKKLDIKDRVSLALHLTQS